MAARNGKRKSKSNPQAVAERTAQTLKGKIPVKSRVAPPKRQGVIREEDPLPATRSRPEASAVVVHRNPSVPIAASLRDKLEPLGWDCHASTDGGNNVNFSATRDSEVISIRIENGKVIDQRYSIWDADRPSTNGAPKSRLPFDPEELSDVDLIKELMGQKVHWWNPLSKKAEIAIIPHRKESKIKVEHVITWADGEPDELPGSRVVSFVDQTPNHTAFRAFRIGALLKIG